MWYGTRRVEQILEQDRWNVEFFAGMAEIALKSGYPLLEVGQIVKESRDSIDPQRHPDIEFNYIGLENVESHSGKLIGLQKKTGSEIKSRSKTFNEGNVLYGRLRPYLNKVYLCQKKPTHGICSNEFIVLIPNKDIVSPKFLRYLLASEYVVRHVASYQSGAALPRIGVHDLFKLKVPVPSLKDQGEIESSLSIFEDRRDSLVQELDDLEKNIDEQLAKSLRLGKPQLFP